MFPLFPVSSSAPVHSGLSAVNLNPLWMAHRRWSCYLIGLSLFGAGFCTPLYAFDNDSSIMLEEIVVTASRVETKRAETPQKIEVITREDIEQTLANDLTEVLKKTAGVDVIQYPGVLSGIGIRGFRPEFGGTNKHSLLLIDGRPAGTENLATVLLDNIERIEVLKGPASALYGSSAMGGVVNIITRRSQGPISGEAWVGYGSFDTRDLGARAGGDITDNLDFDLSASYYNQNDDFRMGSGDIRSHTSYRKHNVNGRLGINIAGSWRLDGKFDVYQARDVSLPGDIFNGETRQGSKDVDRVGGDIKLSNQFEQNTVSLTAFVAEEQSNYIRVTSRNEADQPFLPFKNFESEVNWYGLQAQNDWQWSEDHNLVVGIDYEHVAEENRSFRNTGEPRAPFSADYKKDTWGFYAENTFRFKNGNTVITLGGRYDRINTETLETPLKTDFTPSSASFGTFNPSLGFKQLLWPGWRLHATAGRAFVATDASRLTGFNERTIGGRLQITRGNPDLDPERSFTWDVGVEYADERWFFDLTYFRTKVEDRISRATISSPPAPDPIIISYINADSARINGLELEGSWQIAKPWSLFANVNYFFSRREKIGKQERDIRNVPRMTVRAGVNYTQGPWNGRFMARYLGKRTDNDWNVAGNPIIEYPTFTIADLYLQYRFSKAHSLSLDVNNIFDKNYFEKRGFNLAGRSFLLRYRYAF